MTTQNEWTGADYMKADAFRHGFTTPDQLHAAALAEGFTDDWGYLAHLDQRAQQVEDCGHPESLHEHVEAIRAMGIEVLLTKGEQIITCPKLRRPLTVSMARVPKSGA